MFSIHRVAALVFRDMLIIQRSKWRLFEIFYFPLTTIILWVFFSVYSQTFSAEAGLLILVINLFWNFAYANQSAVNMQLMEDSWSGSLKQLLLSGVSEVEYALARMATAVIISVPVLIAMLAILLFSSWNFIPSLGVIAALSILTMMASLSLSTVISGMIVVLGRNYAFLAWSSLQAFIMLSAPFFPRSVFPIPLSWISIIMPFTFIFESARNLATNAPIHWAAPILSAVIYFIIAWPIYLYFFNLARKNGNLVRIS